ncbi:LuxR C-terminal-related transcriptional regulator [uncultured Duncaniella sp.]|uniref:response regulator transcription factor n=1 Tax=uncultured Duncaniella sp. TaxID=2768039 RepID=UPI0025F13BDD|nr:LuxR C-terminal-related transcriptional regulator [uncultured Duncaniella sp.]
MRHISIALMMPSAILASGLTSVIRRLSDVQCSITEIGGENYFEELSKLHPSILIVDPVNCPLQWDALKSSSSSPIKIIAVLVQQMPKESLKWFDDTISVYDTAATIMETVRRNAMTGEDDDRGKELSPREKEVIVGIVKGLSNKEIASEMNVSVNTVMTHRRNIAAKLHIHTPAGLTIYAIVSNLVKLEDIKSDMGKL